MLTFGSLFAGIGGMDLGLERSGMTCAWQVEIDPFARRVLEKHWPHVKRHDDVRTFPPGDHRDWRVDLIAGGFPCQDISAAGKQAGISGDRSGLWAEFARIVGLVRPRYVLVENVAALLDRGVERVLGDLADLGFDAEWSTVSACSLGAPHLRKRLFILAYADMQRRERCRHERDRHDASLSRGRVGSRHLQEASIPGSSPGGSHWANEPPLDRMADGVPRQLDRLRVLGNAIVPQVAEFIGKLIMENLS